MRVVRKKIEVFWYQRCDSTLWLYDRSSYWWMHTLMGNLRSTEDLFSFADSPVGLGWGWWDCPCVVPFFPLREISEDDIGQLLIWPMGSLSCGIPHAFILSSLLSQCMWGHWGKITKQFGLWCINGEKTHSPFLSSLPLSPSLSAIFLCCHQFSFRVVRP